MAAYRDRKPGVSKQNRYSPAFTKDRHNVHISSDIHHIKKHFFNAESCHETTPKTLAEAFNPHHQQGTIWIDIEGQPDAEMLKYICDRTNLHHYVIDDILNCELRPKVEAWGKSLFLVAKMLDYDHNKQEIMVEQVSFILHDNVLITIQEDKFGDLFGPLRQRLHNSESRLRTLGADYLLLRLLDCIVEHYYVILEEISENLAKMEDELIANPGNHLLEQIYEHKREVMLLRKSIWPMREVMGQMVRSDEMGNVLSKDIRAFSRDLNDRVMNVIETIELYRDMLASMMDIYLSSLSIKMNNVMKVLTVLSAIFIPLTYIVGVYGMNFEFMPEIHNKYGYYYVWILMLCVAGGMLIYFKKKEWF